MSDWECEQASGRLVGTYIAASVSFLWACIPAATKLECVIAVLGSSAFVIDPRACVVTRVRCYY